MQLADTLVEKLLGLLVGRRNGEMNGTGAAEQLRFLAGALVKCLAV
jgi:hypothetical protein